MPEVDPGIYAPFRLFRYGTGFPEPRGCPKYTLEPIEAEGSFPHDGIHTQHEIVNKGQSQGRRRRGPLVGRTADKLLRAAGGAPGTEKNP